LAAVERSLAKPAPDLPFTLTYVLDAASSRARRVVVTGLPDDHPAWALEADYLASGMVALACILSPHKIVLSGGVGRRPGMPEAVATRLEELLADYMPSPQIVAPVLGDRAGVLGALALAMSTAYSAT